LRLTLLITGLTGSREQPAGHSITAAGADNGTAGTATARGARQPHGLSIAAVMLGAVALLTRRHVALGKVRPVRPETSRACWPAAVGDDNCKVGDCDRPGGRDHGQPARVIQEHDDGYDEAHHPHTHHHQVAPLTLADLGRAGQVGLGYQISLVTPGAAMASHGSTLGAGVPGS